MEVHHHPHVEKKRFKEYLLEGLMIFVAVSMGFIAENVREHFTDKERELKYVEAFVNDLKSDTADISITLKANFRKSRFLDSLLLLSKLNLNLPDVSNSFTDYFFRGTSMAIHRPANSAMTQLKNTGSLRLISHKHVIDSILKYDQYNQLIIEHSEIYSKDHNSVWDAAFPIFDMRIFRDSAYLIHVRKRISTNTQIPPLRLNQERMQIFLGHIVHAVMFTEVNRRLLQTQFQRATRLLAFLQKEYDLGKE